MQVAKALSRPVRFVTEKQSPSRRPRADRIFHRWRAVERELLQFAAYEYEEQETLDIVLFLCRPQADRGRGIIVIRVTGPLHVYVYLT